MDIRIKLVITLTVSAAVFRRATGNVAQGKQAWMFNAARNAGLAVDTDTSTTPSTCAQTNVTKTKKRAWWYVDLGEAHRVTNITLFNQEWSAVKHAKTLGDLKMGMSNGSSTDDWTLACNEMSNKDSIANGMPRDFKCSMNNVGRYFYLYRNDGSFKSSMMAVCEVILDGYRVVACSEHCGTGCDDKTGDCVTCDNGYKPPTCTDCEAGYWGVDCGLLCPSTCARIGAICYVTDGRCSGGCAQPMIGDWCNATTSAATVSSFTTKTSAAATTTTTATKTTTTTPQPQAAVDKTVDDGGGDGAAFPLAMVAGGAAGGVVLIAVLAVLVVLVVRKRKARRSQPELAGDNEAMAIEELGSDKGADNDACAVKPAGQMAAVMMREENKFMEQFVPMKNTKTQIALLEQYVMKRESEGGLQEEFYRLKRGAVSQCFTGRRESRMEQNRYHNVIPYDHNRVLLNNDVYINASYIRGYEGREKVYVACQGPKDDTIADTWAMIWQTETCQVVMLTECMELGKNKCEQYWPSKPKDPTKYGDIVVTLSDERVYANFTIRTLEVEKDLETRRVYHLHYTNWPDKTPPDYGFELIQFRNTVRYFGRTGAGPIVTHCSAGLGRTGTLIAVDILLDMVDKQGIVDAYSVVNGLREDRMNMVQTPGQYAFIYTALLDYHKVGHSVIPSTEFEKYYRELQQDCGMYTNETRMEEHFKKLTGMKEFDVKEDDPHESMAKVDDNKRKNRDQDIVPSNRNRVLLKTISTDDWDYINAVYVNTYKRMKGLIVTQVPLDATISDFWAMVLDYKCSIMVLIQGEEAQSNQWWPDEGQKPVSYGEVNVSTTKASKNENITVREFQVFKKVRRFVLPVRQLVLTWPGEKAVPEVGQVLAVLDMMDSWHASAKQDGPPIIMCRDGATQCGLLAASAHIRERLQMDREVDISHSVRSVAAARRQFVNNTEQYRFLHDIAQECINVGDVYANM